jgi:hypothetical protein
MIIELNMLDMGGLPVNIDILLFGNDDLSVEINTFIFSCVQKYIKDTRFMEILHRQVQFKLNNTCIFHRPLTRQSINSPSATKKRIYIHVEVHNVDNCQMMTCL